MHKILATLMLAGFFTLFSMTASRGETTYRVTPGKQVSLDEKPLAMVSSPDGTLLYLLMRGRVLLYAPGEDRMLATLPVERGFDGMTVLKDNYLALSDSGSKLIRLLQLEKTVTFSLDGLPVSGKANAPVTIAVFSDYQCPYCARLEPLIRQVAKNNPQTVRLVYKNYPLPFHRQARAAAAAALAAHDQGKFQEFHEQLFALGGAVSEEKIREIAVRIPLDMGRFLRMRSDSSVDKLIDRDLAEAREVGVNGTPTVFVNGKRIQVQSAESLQQAVDSALTMVNKR